jgi:hypothetical protein
MKTTMPLVRSERGSGLLVALLAMLALIAASTAAMVALVVAHHQRIRHQEAGLQALYLAETGVEELLATSGQGGLPRSLQRTVRREPEAGEALVPTRDASAGDVVAPTDRRPVVGSYEARAQEAGGRLVVRSAGVVLLPGGKPVTRAVRVSCRRARGGWVAERWQQVP